MMIEDNENGTFTVMAGFSNGKSAAGKPILLKSKATKKVLWKGVLDQNGELVCPKQSEPYAVVFDGGPGHSVERDGIVLKEGEAVPDLTASTGKAKDRPDAVTGATRHAKHAGCGGKADGAEVADEPVHPKWVLPLKPDFTDEIKGLMAGHAISVRNSLGLVRETTLMQCFQYHGQSKMGGMVELVEARRKAGRKVDFQVPTVGMCPGAATGYFAMDFAVRQIYGKDLPVMDDFRIECKGKMGGVWDTFELILGRRLSRERGTLGPSPEAFVFVAERLSDAKRVVFTYSDEFKARLGQFFKGKFKSGEVTADEMRRLRQGIVKDLLTRHGAGDFSYFVVLDGGAKETAQ
jgi:hypothetical protein